MNKWCLSELPHPSQPLPPNLLFKFGERFYCLVHWDTTLLNSWVVGPLQVNSTAHQERLLIRRLSATVRRGTQLQTLFATCDGKWVQARAVLPNSNLSYFDEPAPLTPELRSRKVLANTNGLQALLDSMHQAEKKTILDPLPYVTRDFDFVKACEQRVTIGFASRAPPPPVVFEHYAVARRAPHNIDVALGNAEDDTLPEHHVLLALVHATTVADLPVLCMPPVEWNDTFNCLRGTLACFGDRWPDCWVSVDLYCLHAERVGATLGNCDTLVYMTDAEPDPGIARLKHEISQAEALCAMRRTTKSALFNPNTKKTSVKRTRTDGPRGRQTETADHSPGSDQSEEDIHTQPWEDEDE